VNAGSVSAGPRGGWQADAILDGMKQGSWIAVGIAVGVAIGVAIDNIVMGIGIGLALGIAMGLEGRR